MKINILIIFLILLSSTNPSYAYIDPGSGSFVVQVIFATIAGAILSIKVFWENIKNFTQGIFNKNTDKPEQEISKNE